MITPTPMQAARIPAWRQHWLMTALSTTTMTASDWNAAEGAILNLCRRARLAVPSTFFRVQSPQALQLVTTACAGLLYARRVGAAVKDSHELINAVGAVAGQHIALAVRQLVEAAPAAQPSKKVPTARDAQLAMTGSAYRQVHAETNVYGEEQAAEGLLPLDAYDENVGRLNCDVDDLQGSVDHQARQEIFEMGSAWADRTSYWHALVLQVSLMQGDGLLRPAYSSFIRDVCEAVPPEVDGAKDVEVLATRCGPYVIHEDFAVICDRPEVLETEEVPSRDGSPPDLRLHAIGGPAARYRDGFEVFAWHGQHLSLMDSWILGDPSEITPEAVLEESDLRVQQIMREVAAFTGNDAAVYAGAIAA